MEVRNVKDCFRLRILRKIKPDKEKAKKSLEIAEKSLGEAERAVAYKIYEFVILKAYMAMFHASRALLYKDGIQEKSHYAIYVYLKETHSKEIPINVLNLLNIHRTERHEALYGLEYNPNKEDAITALEDSRIFLDHIKRLLITGFEF
mgnify:FL=1